MSGNGHRVTSAAIPDFRLFPTRNTLRSSSVPTTRCSEADRGRPAPARSATPSETGITRSDGRSSAVSVARVTHEERESLTRHRWQYASLHSPPVAPADGARCTAGSDEIAETDFVEVFLRRARL